jgi:hypothetical protein
MQHITRTPKKPLPARALRRIVRPVKALFGVDSYLANEDRRILEQIILPYVAHSEMYQNILFVGCDWYTNGYKRHFEHKNYRTIDPDPSKAKYGAKNHIVDRLENLDRHFRRETFDLIVCNGVIGYGLNAKADAELAFQACGDCLRCGGALVIGWADIDERRPFPPRECRSLRALQPYVFPPLGVSEYLTDTVYRHTFLFYVKPPL